MIPLISNVKVGKTEAYFAPFATKLNRIVDIPVILTGGNRSIENMEKLLMKMELNTLHF